MKNVFIVRHCQAEGQSADARLSDLGLNQANKLTEFLMPKNIDYIISSPYERAYRTIFPLAERLGIEIVTDNRLTERILSEKNHPDWREMLRQTYYDLDLCYEGGESSNVATHRVITVVKELLNSRFENIIIASHGNLISLLLKYFDDRIGYKEWENLSNPDVFHLSFMKDTPNIERIWTD
ncbi:histidine phosphatase family protein [Paenibacillus sp. LMG 31458]|uniref:Histidine phosphatase family protein n=1 Tax=Paenibacillus phytorum TaxID=2654977 RepID=A0ABX1Y1W3_9BACL|nr:histidine phosphatase family protein [Paenibacillus phytorum]NOU74256.1 histidine phosphatase family protein [Paenibacillus phytorum]